MSPTPPSTTGSMLRERSGDSLALVTSDRSWSVEELLSTSQIIHDKMSSHGLEKAGDQEVDGCRVIVPSSNPALYIASLFACFRCGFSVVPWRDASLPVDALAKTTSANVILKFDGATVEHMSLVPTGVPVCKTASNGDLIMMTSGSTGNPKGVVLSAEQILENAMSAGSTLGVKKCDAWAIDIDMALMSATCHALMAWQFDLPLYHLASFSRDQYRTVFQSGKIGFGGSPIQLVRLGEKLTANEAPAMIVSSGDFLTPPMIEKLVSLFPATSINKLYGLTELSGRFCCNTHEDLMQNKAAAGKPLPGFQARLSLDTPTGESGEIEARSSMVFKGYLIDNGQFVPMEDEWFGTGDIGHIDEKGFVTILGRKDDVLKVGGEKVDRHSIEQALSDLFTQHEFCVLGVTHHLLGRCVALFIAVPAGSKSPPTWAETVKQIKDQLPSRFVPSLMYKLDKPLPRLANGKVNAVSLKEQHGEFKRLS